MLVYKYRGGDDKIFERDLDSLEKNYFWSAHLESLNDPQENLIYTDKFVKQSSFISRLFGKKSQSALLKVHESLGDLLLHKERVGIFSLSKSFTDTVLWSHYANSHTGFCIEYNLDKLLDNYVYEHKYHFPVLYNSNPSEVDLRDISNLSSNNTLIQKTFGCKSKEWEYEKEYRIITDDFGIHHYDFEAVKSIYFGLKMLNSQKEELMNRLKGRPIKFYQIIQLEKTYSLDAILIKDVDYSNLSYFKQIKIDSTNSKLIKYEILEKFYIVNNKKAEIKVELESTLEKNQITWLSNFLREHLFQNAERIYIFYYLKSQSDIVWATSHIINGKMEIELKF